MAEPRDSYAQQVSDAVKLLGSPNSGLLFAVLLALILEITNYLEHKDLTYMQQHRGEKYADLLVLTENNRSKEIQSQRELVRQLLDILKDKRRENEI